MYGNMVNPRIHLSYQFIWGFPNIGVPPVLIHFSRVFHEINHPAIGGTPMTSWTPEFLDFRGWIHVDLFQVCEVPQLSQQFQRPRRAPKRSTLESWPGIRRPLRRKGKSSEAPGADQQSGDMSMSRCLSAACCTS